METEYNTDEIWMSIVIPLPQYNTQKTIRTCYLQNENNYAYVDFCNTGSIISLTRVFYKGVEYSASINTDMFKSVKWKVVARYIY